MPKIKYTADYFINKFKSIPNKNWYTGHYVNPHDATQKCALGHCGQIRVKSPVEEAYFLDLLFHNNLNESVGSINDGYVEHYARYKKPKTRILAALRDIKKKQELKK